MGLTGKLRCWQGWVLWRIWGRVPFLAFSASRGCLHSLAPASFPAAPASLAPLVPSSPSFSDPPDSSFPYKDACGDVRTLWTIQDPSAHLRALC